MKKLKRIVSLVLILSLFLVGFNQSSGLAVEEESNSDGRKLTLIMHLIELSTEDLLSHDTNKGGYDGNQITDLESFFGKSAEYADMTEWLFNAKIEKVTTIDGEEERVSYEEFEQEYDKNTGILVLKNLPEQTKDVKYIVKVNIENKIEKLKKAIPMEFELGKFDEGTNEKVMHLYPKIAEEKSFITKRLKVNLKEDNEFNEEYEGKVRYFEKGEEIEWLSRVFLIGAENIMEVSKSTSHKYVRGYDLSGNKVKGENVRGLLLEDIRNSEEINLTSFDNFKGLIELTIDGKLYRKEFNIKDVIVCDSEENELSRELIIKEGEILEVLKELCKKPLYLTDYQLKYDSLYDIAKIISFRDDYKNDLNIRITFDTKGNVVERMDPGNYTNDLAMGDLKASECDGIDEFNIAEYDFIKISSTEVEENGFAKRLPDAKFILKNSKGEILSDKEGDKLTWIKEEDYSEKDSDLVIKEQNFISADDGKIKISGLGEGEYRLIEVEAPEGYYIDGNNPGEFTTTITIDKLGQVIEIPNTPVTIPPTGGIGTIIFVLLGIGLLTFAAVSISKDKKKTEEI